MCLCVLLVCLGVRECVLCQTTVSSSIYVAFDLFCTLVHLCLVKFVISTRKPHVEEMCFPYVCLCVCIHGQRILNNGIPGAY